MGVVAANLIRHQVMRIQKYKIDIQKSQKILRDMSLNFIWVQYRTKIKTIPSWGHGNTP